MNKASTKTLALALVSGIALGSLVGAVNYYLTPKAEPKVQQIQQIQQIATPKVEPKSFISVTKQDLEYDIMKNYVNVPSRAKSEILDTIITVSNKYHINPLILYSMLHVESSMNPYIQHKEIIVDIGGKKVKTKAIGLAAVIFEFWGEKLQASNILKTRADLLDPIVAVEALGFIYDELRKMPMHPNASNEDQSAMLRYFGGSYMEYFNKIDTKIGELIGSKLYNSKD